MLSIKGKYKKGKIRLSQKIDIEKPMDVIVTFLDEPKIEEKNKFDLVNLSAMKSRELLRDYNGCLSDDVIAERRDEL